MGDLATLALRLAELLVELREALQVLHRVSVEVAAVLLEIMPLLPKRVA